MSAETKGVISIQARAYGSPGDLKGGSVIASRSVSMCESCIARTYAEVEAAVDEVVRDV
jgi:hypothetical protein